MLYHTITRKLSENQILLILCLINSNEDANQLHVVLINNKEMSKSETLFYLKRFSLILSEKIKYFKEE